MNINNPANPLKKPSTAESQGEIYSTEETRSGTWIDGKPLYRKVFNVKSASTVYAEEPISDTLHIDTLVSITGGLLHENGDNKLPVNFSNAGNFITTYIKDDKLTMYLYPSAYAGRPTIVVLEYTKTTDEPET